MKETEKHCDTCRWSYTGKENSSTADGEFVERQFCRHEIYTSPAYTHEMLVEEIGRGYCRFWEPREEIPSNQHLCDWCGTLANCISYRTLYPETEYEQTGKYVECERCAGTATQSLMELYARNEDAPEHERSNHREKDLFHSPTK